MTAPPTPHDDEADARYWRSNTRLIALLTFVWALLSFVLPLTGIESVTLFGAPFSLWMTAQGVPIAYVLIVWLYERRMDRLEQRQQPVHDRHDG